MILEFKDIGGLVTAIQSAARHQDSSLFNDKLLHPRQRQTERVYVRCGGSRVVIEVEWKPKRCGLRARRYLTIHTSLPPTSRRLILRAVHQWIIEATNNRSWIARSHGLG